MGQVCFRGDQLPVLKANVASQQGGWATPEEEESSKAPLTVSLRADMSRDVGGMAWSCSFG